MPTKKQYLEAVERSDGNMSQVARHMGVNRRTLYKAAEKYPEIKEAIQEKREMFTDEAESILANQIREGNTTSLIFYLKTQGKDRGYVERQEQHIAGRVDLSSMSEEQLEAMARGEFVLTGSG